MQYFASFEPFEIFDEFNGVQGTYIKSFLISDKINLNDWQATHEANMANLESFLGRPGIHYINPENGKRDHTGATSFEKSLQIQELYRAASIIAVGSDIPTKKNWQVSKMADDDIAQKIKSKEIKLLVLQYGLMRMQLKSLIILTAPRLTEFTDTEDCIMHLLMTQLMTLMQKSNQFVMEQQNNVK